MNKDMAAAQYAGPLYQDPVPPMANQSNPMNSGMTGANQGFLGAQQNPSTPNGMAGFANAMGNNGPMNNNSMGNQQQTIMMSSNDGPNFNNNFNGVNSMGNPIAPPMLSGQNNDLSMRPKLKLDIKKLLIIGAVVLIVLAVVLCLVFSKTITCTTEENIQGAKVETSLKVSYWFNRISKIETKVVWDMSNLDNEAKEMLKKTYEELDDGSNVEITDKKIVISKVHKPTKKDKENGADKIKPDELIEDYESSGLTCK